MGEQSQGDSQELWEKLQYCNPCDETKSYVINGMKKNSRHLRKQR
jgi:hypothetical protein